MKKYGKYEKQPEVAPANKSKVKSTLLQTYLTSLLCMVLCVSMFFGTSYAWFTSEVQNPGNEIYVGTLKVGLYKMKNDSPVSLSGSDADSEKLFNSDIRWEPGYTTLETIQVVNEGDLAFKYRMSFTSSDTDIASVAENFEVWVFNHYQKEYVAPGSYEDMVTDSVWVKVGTLAEVLNGKAVLEDRSMYTVRQDDSDADGNVGNGTADGVKTIDTYTIALHMKEDTSDANLMGKKITLNVKLVAYQMGSEKDAFGDAYDNKQFVSTEQEFIRAMENPDGGTVVLIDDINVTSRADVVGNVVLDMNGHKLTDETAGMTIWVKPDGCLTITGNGEFLKTDHNQHMIYFDGELNIMNGTYAYESYTWGNCAGCEHGTNALAVGCLLVGREGNNGTTALKGKLNIYGGYFDSGVLNPEAFTTTNKEVSPDGKPASAIMYPVLNNHATYDAEITVYGGVFVSANPANGDCNKPHSLYLLGQTEPGVVPDGYTVLEGTTEDGRTTYTYSYKAPTSAAENG